MWRRASIPRLVYVFDAGHYIEVNQPERFVALVRDLFARGEAFIVNPGDEVAGAEGATVSWERRDGANTA